MSIIKAFLLVSSVFALPANIREADQSITTSSSAAKETPYQWDWNWNTEFTIHSSCNDTQYNQISAGLSEAKVISGQARDHTLRWGNESEIYQRYFGNASTAEVIGWFDLVVNGKNDQYLFRCDDIDGNCGLDGWAGHWRGENGTFENVICDLSYTDRLYLSQMCSQGYTVANSKNSLFWATDLLHRLWHTPMGQGVVEHYADTYQECLELAISNPSEAVRNSATLRYYALDVYAYDISSPGVGCTGKIEDTHDHGHDQNQDSSIGSASSAVSSTVAVTSTTSKLDTVITTTTKSCHTHANGKEHCE